MEVRSALPVNGLAQIFCHCALSFEPGWSTVRLPPIHGSAASYAPAFPIESMTNLVAQSSADPDAADRQAGHPGAPLFVNIR